MTMDRGPAKQIFCLAPDSRSIPYQYILAAFPATRITSFILYSVRREPVSFRTRANQDNNSAVIPVRILTVIK